MRASIRPAIPGKALLNILENYPRTELFQAETDVLFESAMAILQLEERPRVRALFRRDRFDRFVSVLVFVPRDRYTSDLRERIGRRCEPLRRPRLRLLPDFSMTHLTRVQFIIGRNPGEGPDPRRARSKRIRAMVRTFDDDLAEALNAAFPPERAAELLRSIGRIRPDYRASFSARGRVDDIDIAEGLTPG